MSLNNQSFLESDNYYIPFLDLMAGIVFILMVILSSEMMNVKYLDAQGSFNKSIYENLNKINLFKKKFVLSISTSLNEKNIKNTVSSDFNSIYIQDYTIFESHDLLLNKKGKDIAKCLSDVFDKNLFFKASKDQNFKKEIDFIKSISVNIYPLKTEGFESSAMAKSFVFYGYLVNMNPQILSFSNGYYPRLIHINKSNSLPRSFENLQTDIIFLNFEFCYPQNEKII